MRIPVPSTEALDENGQTVAGEMTADLSALPKNLRRWLLRIEMVEGDWVAVVDGAAALVDRQMPSTVDTGAQWETIDTAITAALTELQTLIDAPEVGVVPAGTMTTAQLSAVVRSMRDVVQQNRAGAQRIALTLKQTIRLVRGDFDAID